jgi:O-antigen/teichoic acid export membrane protein
MRRKLTSYVRERVFGSSTVRSVGWNYAGYLYQIGINIGATAYIARQLPVPEYGLLLFVLSLSGALYLLDMGISGVLLQFYVAALLEPARTRFNRLLSTASVTLAALGTLGALLLGVVSTFLPGPFNIPQQYLHAASNVVILAAFMILFGLPSVALDLTYQAAQRFDRLNQIQFFTSTLQLALTVGVLAAGLHVVALAAVQLAVTATRLLILALMLPSTIPNARLTFNGFDTSLLRPLLSHGKWAFFNNIGIYALELLVWILLGTVGSMEEAALYGLASKLPSQLWSLVDRGADVFLPKLSKSSAECDLTSLRRTYLRVQRLVFGAVLPFIVLGCVFAHPLIETWVGKQYGGAATVMQWLLLAAFAHAVGYPSHQLFYACMQQRKEAAITIATVVMIAICCVLLSRFGAVGLAIALALPPFFLNCVWATPAACKLAHVSPWAVLREATRGLTWPVCALAVGVILSLLLWRYLSPFWLVLAAVVVGFVYLGIWIVQAAIPIHRSGRILHGEE